MQYLKVRWLHDIPSEPILLYSELDDQRWEVRKVEMFADGATSYAGPDGSTGSTLIGLIPVPSIPDIVANAEFEAEEIGEDEFERMWSQAINA